MTEVAVSTQQETLTDLQRDRIYRRNFWCFMSDFLLFTVGMKFIGATTVIPDFIRQLTDSEIMIALSSQLFEAGWLLPQLFVARYLVRVANKKWWFVGPNIPVRPLMLIFAGVIILLGEDHRTAILIAFLIFYALAALGDGLVGVPWLDLMGTSLDNKRRARLFGWGTALVGIIMLPIAPQIQWILGENGPGFPENYAVLFGLAGILFIVTIPGLIFIKELPGATAQATMPSLREYGPQLLHVLREDLPFRGMISARILVGLFMLAGPFYIGFATERLDMPNSVAVSQLLLMQTLGSVSGSLVLSWMGNGRTLLFIRLALGAGIMQASLALLASVLGPPPLYLAFFAAGVMSDCLSLSFMNWLVGYSTPDQRPIYSGLFNSSNAITFLVAPLSGGIIVETLGYEAVFTVALGFMLCALFVVLRYLKPLPGRAI